MHDIRSIRENPAAFDKGLRNRGMEPLSERLIALDDARKSAVSALQAATERRNAMSKEIGQAKAKKDEARAQELMAEVARIKESMPELEEAERAADKALFEALAAIPNIPKEDVPVGADEHTNVERYRFGTPPTINSAKQHFEIGEALGLMDFETAAKLSGARFVILKGQLARLERALGQFMIDLHVNEHGYTEVSPPLLVRDDTMFGTAQLPKFEDDQFWAFPGSSLEQAVAAAFEGQPREAVRKMIKDARYGMIPTAEVTLTNLVREQILSEEELPLRFTAL
ncbi:MAG TPA: serine--tRNA ligase, partial [Microvirga sp.]|nr:serine--tRNA ligase [Microvirga sp.]